jgi:hypothetical protein
MVAPLMRIELEEGDGWCQVLTARSLHQEFPLLRVQSTTVQELRLNWDLVPRKKKGSCKIKVIRFVTNYTHHLHAGFLLGLFFDPEDGGDIFLRKVR